VLQPTLYALSAEQLFPGTSIAGCDYSMQLCAAATAPLTCF